MRSRISILVFLMMSVGISAQVTPSGVPVNKILLKTNATGKTNLTTIESNSTVNKNEVSLSDGDKVANFAVMAGASGAVVEAAAYRNDLQRQIQFLMNGNAGSCTINSEDGLSFAVNQFKMVPGEYSQSLSNTENSLRSATSVTIDSIRDVVWNESTGANSELKLQTFQFLATVTDSEGSLSQIELNPDVIGSVSKIDVNTMSEIRQSPDNITSSITNVLGGNGTSDYHNSHEQTISDITNQSKTSQKPLEYISTVTTPTLQSVISLDPNTSNEGTTLLTRNLSTGELNKFETTAVGLEAISSDGLSANSTVALDPFSVQINSTSEMGNSSVILNSALAKINASEEINYKVNDGTNYTEIIQSPNQLGWSVATSPDISTFNQSGSQINFSIATIDQNSAIIYDGAGTKMSSDESGFQSKINQQTTENFLYQKDPDNNRHSVTQTAKNIQIKSLDFDVSNIYSLVKSQKDTVSILMQSGANSVQYIQSASEFNLSIQNGSDVSSFLQSGAQFDLSATNFNLLGNANLRNVVLNAGTTSRAPLRFSTGTNLTTPTNGTIEYDGTNYFATTAGTRKTIDKVLTTTASLNFPSTPANSSSTLTVSVTGASDGDVVSIGVPSASVVANTSYWGYVSATNTVTIVMLNNEDIDPADPAVGTFRVSVSKL